MAKRECSHKNRVQLTDNVSFIRPPHRPGIRSLSDHFFMTFHESSHLHSVKLNKNDLSKAMYKSQVIYVIGYIEMIDDTHAGRIKSIKKFKYIK